jgi:O-antigen/teichoic acid export membrane protein
MQDLRAKTIRAGLSNIAGRGASFTIRLASIIVLGRLLDPTDYGLVGMVTAVTGMLGMFGGFGLFQAAIQRDLLTNEQASTLFWLNLLLGALLTLVCFLMAPVVSAFYHEPRLVPIMCVVGIGFVITGAGTQHGAQLQREMRFGISAVIDLVSLSISTTVAIAMAAADFGYWAVVSPAVALPLATTIGLWLATGWVPGLPRWRTGIAPMLSFGGMMTLNGLVAAANGSVDKLLLGRFWGAEALGLYGRAYHLIWFPCDNINVTIGEVAFAALSRTKEDPARCRKYFLSGYSLVVALTLPLTAICALFAEDLIAVALGPKWGAAVDIFRIMAPTIMVFAISNPLGWLVNALGFVKRGLLMSLVSAPLLIAGVVVGLPHGPKGVAIAYSTVMLAKVIPIAWWALQGTGIRTSEILLALVRPLAATMAAGGIAYAGHVIYGPILPLVPRLLVDLVLFSSVYLTGLLFVAGQGSLYVDLLRAVRPAPSV